MDAQSLKFIAVGLMALGMVGAAIGVGNIFSSAVSAISRNPSAESKIFKYAIIGAGLTEAMGIFSFAIALILLFVIK
jgi:F-type H+-transporting ATPase subunit c